MSGAASRSKGNRYERAVAEYLRGHGYPDAATTRAVLGHGGTRQPGDVVGPVGVSIECKDVRSGTAWPSWLAQAARQAGHLVPVVVRKLPGVADVGRHPTVLPYDDYLDRLDGVPAVVRRASRTCHAELWLSRPDHDRIEWFDGRRSWAVVRFAELARAARTEA